MALSHATAVVQELPARKNGAVRSLDTYYRLNYDLMIDVVWILALVAIIMVKDGPMIFR